MAMVFTRESKSKIYETFAVRQHEPVSYEIVYKPSEWLHKDSLTDFMENYGTFINAPSSDMTATFWANRYSRYIAFFHWAVAKGWDADTSLEMMKVYLCARPDKKEPAFEFYSSFEEGAHFTDKHSRQERLSAFYRNHASPLMHAFASAAGVRTRELWGQLYHTVPYFIHLAKVTESHNLQNRLMDDWHFITKEAAPSIFRENNFSFQFKVIPIPNPADDKPMYTKPTCCLAFKASDCYCYRCPRMKPKQRQKLYEQKKK
ncbi:hypothetical protein [Alteribacillus bidgolensis]|uniref:Ferric iron reductase protein FhuF, involved in iron transport n=1 Tax=Alteribacillus bidgolensis TaxID=930129 RepID=A0A1G8L5S2_9BACI|nr:hypothetical protein [Alteribacillus bidgolensis]SDI50921.1 Ferric iron reductase protein FhuF, involved in iron transport [Alteribacillus bidgolensis]